MATLSWPRTITLPNFPRRSEEQHADVQVGLREALVEDGIAMRTMHLFQEAASQSQGQGSGNVTGSSRHKI